MPPEPAQAAVWCVRLRVPEPALAPVEAALGQLGGALVIDGPEPDGFAPVSLYLTEEPARPHLVALLAAASLAAGAALPEPEVELLPETDWVARSRAALPALNIGPFYIHGAHIEEPAPAGSIPLLIEASVAFGTGRHESTRGCLLALAELAQEGRRITRALDMGCGTGILALAVAKLWACPVIAVDSDPGSVRLAEENARANGAAGLVRAAVEDGYGPAAGSLAPYDLIVANILAEPLAAMAQDLVRHLAPGGVAVLSGMLEGQDDAVVVRHAPLRPLRRLCLDRWVTLVVGS